VISRKLHKTGKLFALRESPPEADKPKILHLLRLPASGGLLQRQGKAFPTLTGGVLTGRFSSLVTMKQETRFELGGVRSKAAREGSSRQLGSSAQAWLFAFKIYRDEF